MANKIEYIFSLRDQISAKLAGDNGHLGENEVGPFRCAGESPVGGRRVPGHGKDYRFAESPHRCLASRERMDSSRQPAGHQGIQPGNRPAYRGIGPAGNGGRWRQVSQMGIGSLRRDTGRKPLEKIRWLRE